MGMSYNLLYCTAKYLMEKQMEYVANPVIVTAYKIKHIGNYHIGKGLELILDNDSIVYATPEMLSRITPEPLDYWVIQSDGYIYLNPKDVFERKYSPRK